MRYTHFALLRCCINLNGLFLLCNSYYIKLAIESPVSFCCNSAEVFIKLFSPKQIICSRRSSCRNPQMALQFIILLGNLERTLIMLFFRCYDILIILSKLILSFREVILQLLGVYHSFIWFMDLFSFQDKKLGERRGKWEQDTPPKVLILY